MTDPSRIVFGISPPPRTRGAPIARALIHDGSSVGLLLSSQPNQAPTSPSSFRSPAHHNPQDFDSPPLLPLVACESS